MDQYNSSEEYRRHKADVFANEQAEADAKKAAKTQTERDKLKKLIDKYITLHASTRSVRDEAKKHSRTNDYQLDLSADIVEVLEKIKSELR